MLQPDTRRVLLEALRPPEGYAFDCAVATTYTLDLTALLVAPLAFGMLDGLSSRGKPTASHLADTVDPFALLKAVRGNAERTTVFCQAGRIAVPRKYRRLLTYIEGSVVPVALPSGLGVFHPKLWALRMKGPDREIAYRVLCLSRNLTFDTSWDTAVVLDGTLDQDRTRAIAANHPLGEFFEALPALAVNPMGRQAKADVALIADELRKVRFELPEGFDECAFYPIGIAGRTGAPFDDTRCDKRLVISPFVTAGGIAELSGEGGTLISRLEELDALPVASLQSFEKIFVLNDQADQLEDAEEQEAVVDEHRPPPIGLHAKLYVTDDGWNTHLWTGSANATTAAFAQNVEFLMRLRAKRSTVGVDALLDQEGPLSPLLVEYTRTAELPGPTDGERALEEHLREVRAALAQVRWAAVTADSSTDKYPFSLHARSKWSVPADVKLTARPISLAETYAKAITAGTQGLVADFPDSSFEALTSFFAITLEAKAGELSAEETFVINAPLEGAPANRTARVLQSLLEDPAKVLRFLRLLLAMDPFEVLGALDPDDGLAAGPGLRHGGYATEAPLLEAMLKALSEEPSRLDSIAQVVADLQATEDGKARLPPGFLDAWLPIQKARETLRGASND